MIFNHLQYAIYIFVSVFVLNSLQYFYPTTNYFYNNNNINKTNLLSYSFLPIKLTNIYIIHQNIIIKLTTIQASNFNKIIITNENNKMKQKLNRDIILNFIKL